MVIRETKIKLFMSLISNIIVAVIASIIIYFILALFFENTLSELVARLNYDLYSWIVYNRDIVVYIYIIIVLSVVIFRFISKQIDDINQVYNSLDLILKEDNETIKLPNEVSEFAEKLNDIKYNYIASKNSERDAQQKKNDLKYLYYLQQKRYLVILIYFSYKLSFHKLALANILSWNKKICKIY